jgi:hypothetical protein
MDRVTSAPASRYVPRVLPGQLAARAASVSAAFAASLGNQDSGAVQPAAPQPTQRDIGVA